MWNYKNIIKFCYWFIYVHLQLKEEIFTDFKFSGKFHDYNIEDNNITIYKKNDTIYSGSISDIILLCFVENNIVGAGQIVLSLPNRDKVFADGFRKNDRSNFIKLFEILKEKTDFMDLDYMKAMRYLKPEARKEKESQRNAKDGQKKKKMELLRKGFRPIEETKCVCTQCNAVWFYGKEDKLNDISNRLISAGAFMQGKTLTGSYHEQLIKDTNKCPKCGSKAIARTKVKYWFNSKSGESIEFKE